ncbi:outer membrane beta-barrel protein, partial [Vibrio sp. 10N.239.312.C11]|uniref:outer membrane beta-barrel protein n=2 Tax=Vibrio TaxID=662 RepID=UPI00355195DF
MLKKLIAVATVIYAITGYAAEYNESFYITPKLDFVNQLDSEDSADFGIGYALDIGVPVYKFVSVESIVRYIDWNSDQFDSNFLQFGALLKLNFPFTDKTNFALSGGLLADLDVGNEARGKEVNPYIKLDVDYNISNNWAVVLGFNRLCCVIKFKDRTTPFRV